MKKAPPAPKALSADSRRLWAKVVRDYPSLRDPVFLQVLEQSLHALDRANALRERIDREGPSFKDRFKQLRAHPLLASERDARSQFFLGVKTLGLDPTEIGD